MLPLQNKITNRHDYMNVVDGTKKTLMMRNKIEGHAAKHGCVIFCHHVTFFP